MEAALLGIVILTAFLGFSLVAAAAQLRQGGEPLAAFPAAWLPPGVLALALLAIHLALRGRRTESEQIILPVVGLLLAIGLTMIGRLQLQAGVWQQVTRGLLPGAAIMALFIARPGLVERIRRDWPVTISLAGLLLLLATAFFGVVDESGARLSLKLGPLPAVQTSELIKLALVIFLAWYIESVGEEAEARARSIGWLRLPALRYFVPGTLFVLLATLALVKMSDFGAILILGCLFVSMLYAGFQTRIFSTIAAFGVALSLLAGLVLTAAWEVPAVIQQRFAAFLDPWSAEPLLVDGAPTGLTIAEGPGYQIQQSLYALTAGGMSGTGLGLGSPGNIPLAHSEFIFAAIVEETGAIVGLALLICFAILLLRILRLAILLPQGQAFERLLLVGIGVHLFIQVFVMVGGTLNLLPVTGITIPFLSQGGMALTVNLMEVGIVLALAQQLKVTSNGSMGSG